MDQTTQTTNDAAVALDDMKREQAVSQRVLEEQAGRIECIEHIQVGSDRKVLVRPIQASRCVRDDHPGKQDLARDINNHRVVRNLDIRSDRFDRALFDQDRAFGEFRADDRDDPSAL